MRGQEGRSKSENTRMRMCRHAGRFDSGPARQRAKAYFSRQELIILQGSFQYSDSRKDGRVPGTGQRCERRDGFRLMRLVMSIIYLHISY